MTPFSTMTIKEGLAGGATSLGFSIAAIPLESVNRTLTTCSLIVGLLVGVVTLYRIFRHRDNQAIVDRLDAIEKTCASRTICPGFNKTSQ